MNILVVDDSMMSRKMLIDKLLSLEVAEPETIVQGKNGQEGVELYKEHRPDIVFLDLTMPIMDGYEALDLIIKFDPSAFVVVVSADEQPKAIQKVMELGAKRHVSKATPAEELLGIVKELIAKRSF